MAIYGCSHLTRIDLYIPFTTIQCTPTACGSLDTELSEKPHG